MRRNDALCESVGSSYLGDKEQNPILGNDLREKVFSHIRENASKKAIYLDLINGTIDHVHCLVSLKSDQTIARLAQLLKGESSHWVNHENQRKAKFEWQDEYRFGK
jgi:REP element-mobilizing transposase RayT